MQPIETAECRPYVAVSNKARLNIKTVLSAAMATRCAPLEG